MAFTVTHINVAKSCFKIVFCLVVFRSIFHLNKLKQTSELQTSDTTKTGLQSIRGHSVAIHGRPSYEFHEKTFLPRNLLGLKPTAAEDANCTKRGIESFPTLFTNEQRLNGAVVINFLVAFYMCGIIGYICEQYFVPSLEVICDELDLQPDVAGATFMAAGSSAPEFFTAVIGTFISEDDTALSAIVGSAAFNIFIIISFCCFFAGKDVTLTWYPLFRDCVFYVLSVFLLVIFIYDSEVQWWEGLIMTLSYFLYIVIMYFNPYLSKTVTDLSKLLCRNHKQTDTTSLIGQDQLESGKYGTTAESTFSKQYENGVANNNGSVRETDILTSSGKSDPLDSPILESKKLERNQQVPEVFQPPENPIFKAFWILGLPVVVITFITVPDCSQRKWRKWFFVTFTMSLVWLMGTSYVLYWMITVMGYTFGFPDTVMGITLLAGGTSVPDLISSVLVARHGFGDMALSNVIGSNIFDVLICLGLMWFLKGVISEPVSIATDGLTFTSVSLLVTVVFVIVAIALNGWKLNIKLGIICLLVYIAFITFAILRELGIFGGIEPPIYCT